MKNRNNTIILEGGGINYKGIAPTLRDQIKAQGIDLDKFLKGEPQEDLTPITEQSKDNTELKNLISKPRNVEGWHDGEWKEIFQPSNLEDFHNKVITPRQFAGKITTFFKKESNNSQKAKYINRDERLKRMFDVLKPLNEEYQKNIKRYLHDTDKKTSNPTAIQKVIAETGNNNPYISDKEMIALTNAFFGIEALQVGLADYKDGKDSSITENNFTRVYPEDIGKNTETEKGGPAKQPFSSLGGGVQTVSYSEENDEPWN